MSAFGDFLESGLLEYLFRNTAAPTRPANLYIAALTAIAGDTPTEAAPTGYARQPLATGAGAQWTAAAAVGGGYGTDNSAVIEFGPWSTGPTTVVGVAIYDAVSAGNLWFIGYLSTVRRVFTMNDTAADVFVSPGHSLANDDRVILRVQGDGVLPTGASADTLYYVINTNAGAGTFQLSATSGGASLALSAVGSGEWQLVTPKVIGVGDYFRLPIGQLDVILR